MGTIVAIETDDGVAIAGDRRTTHSGTVTGDTANRVFDLDGIGAGAVGQEGDVDEFRRQLEAELREAELERGMDVDADSLGRIAARVAQDAGVDAVVAARDGDGAARLRQVGPDGSVLSDRSAAVGTGAELALGRLESADRDVDLAATEEFLRETVESLAERDPETGDEVELWSLASESTEA